MNEPTDSLFSFCVFVLHLVRLLWKLYSIMSTCDVFMVGLRGEGHTCIGTHPSSKILGKVMAASLEILVTQGWEKGGGPD